jgi:hypothetical protein
MPMTWSAETVDAEVARHNPVRGDLSDAACGEEASELLLRILGIECRNAMDRTHQGVTPDDRAPRTQGRSGVRMGLAPLRNWRAVRPKLALAVVVLFVLGTITGALAAFGGSGLGAPIKTPWQPARALPARGSAQQHAGTWQLVDALLTGSWQQNVYGPPPGWFSCSSDGACYVLAGQYPSAEAGAPLLSESLYVSTDQGATWSVLPVPSGLVPTTALECSGPQWCATGATYDGQSVLAITRDRGHSFTIDPLPAGAGTLHDLSCPSTGACEGLVATASVETTPVDATFLVTDDGGSTFHDEPIVAGDSMDLLVCTSGTDCTAVGRTDASVRDTVPSGVSVVTSDQGRTWTVGSLPGGFGITDSSTLVCPDVQHCFVTGLLPMQVQDPPLCAGIPSSQRSAKLLPAMSPQAEAISKRETEILAREAAQQTTPNFVTCGSGITDVYDIASSSDGGDTWALEVPPSDVPRPWLTGLACPTATECWAAGQESVPRKFDGGTDMASPVLIGTTNGGSTWSKVVFSVPATAPDYTGQSYLSMGSIVCTSASVCIARGAAAQGSNYAPMYTLVEPGH